MKKIVFIASLLVFSGAQAAEVVGARMNFSEGVIEVDVRYGGGCKKHEFDLQIGGCFESMPVQCSAKLLHNSNGDMCEAYLGETLKFSLEQYGLTDGYYSGGSLTIMGDGGSRATVRLP